MQNELILNRIENLRGRKPYEEKKAAKLGFASLYECFEDKIVKEARRKLDVNRILVEETRAVITEEIRRNHFVKALTEK